MADSEGVEALTSADRDAMVAVDQSAFAFDERKLDLDTDTAWIEWDRAFGARREGALAGIYAVFSFGLTVPGGAGEDTRPVPMAGLSWVSVHPDHRRRGVLTAMMRHHLETVHEDGRSEPISCLFASEGPIYGRFGYGLSTLSRRLTLAGKSPLRPLADDGSVTTRFESAEPARHDGLVRSVYEAACRLRPGHTLRPETQWRRHLVDVPERRPGGAESLKILVAERDGRPTGYALLRRSQSWGEHGPDGKVAVRELQAVDAVSRYALWRRILDFDLMSEVSTPDLPYDDPLLLWAGELTPRGRSGNELWTRVVDVPAALTARGYAAPLDVVLEVQDDVCPWNAGRWRLSADPAGAVCERSGDAVDVHLGVRELGSVYLGGVTLQSLLRAGLATESTPGAVAACSAAFRSDVLPATPYMF